MKTLIVSYLPRGERSHTKKLLDAFLSEAKNTQIEHLDLTKDVPDLLLPVSVGTYIQRNYLKQPLSPEQKKSMSKMDRMAAQFKSADVVVAVYPMHNFSLPAVMKAYFDSVMQKGETWDADEKGFRGLMQGKKALILMASGGIYEGGMASWEHAMSLGKVEFQFMGFGDVRGVHAAGMNALPEEKIEQVIDKAKKEAQAIANEWYL